LTGSDGRPPGTGPTRIAVDLLGGDDAPAVVVDGALQACDADPNLQLLLVGSRPAVDECLRAAGPVAARLAVTTVERGVGMAGPAADGADPRTSIGACLQALKAGRVDAVVSAGASGPTVAAAVVAVGRLRGVRRPALAAVLPSLAGPLVLLDVGANMQVKVADLVHHAALGAAYARLVAGVRAPRIGLLSVGAEPGKGDRLRRGADSALRSWAGPERTYVGPVEGHDVVLGERANVVVSDGFTGNALLKGVEAAFAVMARRHPTDGVPRAAALLGVAGTVVVCHGAATAPDIASGLGLAARLVREDVVARLAAAASGSVPVEPYEPVVEPLDEVAP
jgi:glycerol-3-phosphate acyltransferase PlsX